MKTYRITNRVTQESVVVRAASAQEACASLGWWIGDCHVKSVETERAYLVEIGEQIIQLNRIEGINRCPPNPTGTHSETPYQVQMMSGKSFWLNKAALDVWMEKLDAWHLLAS